MIYLDNAATTAMYPECLDIIKKYAVDEFYNPSALYTQSLNASKAVKQAREDIAKVLGCRGEELVFTASGSEADNFALTCGIKKKKGTIIISAVEHPAVYNCAKMLTEKGYELKIAPVNRYGQVIAQEFEKLIDDSVVFVSIMHVCNETGACNDIKKLVEIAKSKNKDIIFHSDGIQAFCKLKKYSVKDLGVDLYSISGHKIHAPKGIGALYISPKLNLTPFIYGGGQERNLRSGTENVASICSFAYCAQRLGGQTDKIFDMQKSLQTRLADKLVQEFGDIIRINTDINESTGNIFNFSFNGIRGEVMLHFLEQYGIIVGTGSACSSKKVASRIPQALGLNGAFAEGTLRISFSESTTEQDIDYLVEKLAESAKVLGKYKRV